MEQCSPVSENSERQTAKKMKIFRRAERQHLCKRTSTRVLSHHAMPAHQLTCTGNWLALTMMFKRSSRSLV